MQVDPVPVGHRARLGAAEVNLELEVELPPPGLRHLVRGPVHFPDVVLEAPVQPELHLPDEGGQVLLVVGLDEEGPPVGVVPAARHGDFPFEFCGGVAVHDGLEDLSAFVG